jgi:hypothetical protein
MDATIKTPPQDIIPVLDRDETRSATPLHANSSRNG